MQKELKNTSSLLNVILKTVIIEIIVTAVSMAIFSVIMFLGEIKYEYSNLFGTLSVAIGLLVATYITTLKKGSKGLLTGLITGGITFLTVLIISIFINGGPLTYNTLFHLIIFILSAVIGGILGVNKSANKKYI